MKALMSVTAGGPETLEIRELEDAAPGPGHVALKIEAAGVNFPDTLIIRDLYQFKPPRPFIPGNEAAGTIEAVGDGVEGLKVGDRVAGLIGISGAFATRAVVPAPALYKIGDLPAAKAAGMVMTHGTSFHALQDRGTLKSGETLLVLGAAGGVGSAAIELGKAMGAKVVAAVSSEEKAAFARDLGADETVIYPTGALDKDAKKELSAAFKSACGGKGADVIYDAVGGDYAEPAFRSIAWGGRFLVVGFPAGIPSLPLNLPLLKGADIVGVFFGGMMQAEPARHRKNMEALVTMAAEGKISPRITETFQLENAAQALVKLEARQATGKLVIEME